MPQAQDEAGNIWETDAQGNAVRLLRRAGGGGRVYQDPYKAASEGRANEDQAMERERLRLAQEAANLARDRAAVDAEKAARERGTTNARGGVDSTESERTAAFLATRVAGGLQDLQRIGNAGAPSLKDAVVGGTLLGNYTTDASRQRTINAQRDILDAALTLGTGAAYTKEQIEAYRASYFPQPGDAPETVQDKSVRLQRLLEAGKLKAGASAGMIDEALQRSLGAPNDGAPTPGPTVTPEYGLFDPNVSVSDESRPTPPATPSPTNPQGFGQSYAGQGISGANEGLAEFLGAPVDLTTMAMNLVPQGLNAVANTSIPEIRDPFLGSEWIKDKMDGWAIRPESSDPSKQFVRRVGKSVGSAALPAAGAGTMSRALQAFTTAAGGGVGAATAEQVFPNNPAAEFAGEVLGSGLTAGGIIGGQRRRAVRQAMEAVPSRDQLRDQARNLYETAESRGVVAGPNVTTNLAGRVNQIARDNELITPTGRVVDEYPRAAGSMRLLDDYSGQSINPRQIQVIRQNLNDAVQGTRGNERRIAREMLNAFDAETTPLAPELADARRVASRYLQSDEIQGARNLAEPRAAQFSGSGMENALRTEFRKLDRDIINENAQFNPAAEDAIRDVSRGTRYSNAMRALGKLAPTGVVSGGLSAGVPFAIGNAVGGPAVGGAASLATMGLGTVARRAATNAIEDQVRMADAIARNGGALNLPPLVDDETRRALERALAAQGTQYIPR